MSTPYERAVDFYHKHFNRCKMCQQSNADVNNLCVKGKNLWLAARHLNSDVPTNKHDDLKE